MNIKLSPLLFIIATLCLLPAINGPLQLDDFIHLEPIQNWLNTRTDTFALIFGNNSGPFGRPVSIFTFVLNALTTGPQIWAMKLSNLLLHLLTGICLAALFVRLFKRDSNLIENAGLAGVSAAALWLILPQHVSTVFYIIQRMTILASLFAVLACWSYVVARERIEANRKHGLLFLAGTVVLAILSILSKESGVLVPLYCLLIECIYFKPSHGQQRPGIITWGFRLGVIYPCILAIGYLSFNPDVVMRGYIDRAFTMQERLMTQISVVADYFASTFIPMVRSAGLFNDDFPIARNISSHETMILVAGAALIGAAIMLRKNYASFSAGIGIFFIGHLLESSIFSLEIYFSHRNYLPSMGLVLAAYGLIAGLLHRYPEATISLKRIMPAAFIGLFLVYCLASFSRATLWSNTGTLLTHALRHHPDSSRLRSELFLNALYTKRLDAALQQVDIAAQTAPQNEKRTMVLWRILAYCYSQSPIPKHELEALKNVPADKITLATGTALGYIGAAAEANACPGLDRKELGVIAGQWAVSTIQPPDSQWVWKTHLSSARLLASGGDVLGAFKQADWAFTDSAHNFNAGILAYQLANSLDDHKHAQEVMAKLVFSKPKYTKLQQAQLDALRNQ